MKVNCAGNHLNFAFKSIIGNLYAQMKSNESEVTAVSRSMKGIGRFRWSKPKSNDPSQGAEES